MSRSLKLLPFDGPDFSHTVLWVDDTNGMYDAINDIQHRRGRPVCDGFSSYLGYDTEEEESTYGITELTGYVKRVQTLQVRDLLDIDTRLCPHNAAIIAYLDALPVDTEIALYWD